MTSRNGELEHQLRQAQKWNRLGVSPAGGSRLQQHLTVITGRADFLIGAANLIGEQEGDLQEIKTAADRAGDLTRQFLPFSRKSLLQPRLVDLNREVDQVEPMLRRLIGEDIQIVVVRGKSLGRVMADPGQVNQVLLNLALNARDAMPSGGLLTILTANEPGTTNGNGGNGNHGHHSVVLEVTDSGCGMDEATASQIFEPFFTTKGEGKGTGLGLATVYGIVKQSGATISVRSAPEMGTTFRIVFPVADAIDPAQLIREKPETDDAGSETILLVEDDNSVRDLAQRVLEMRGYKILPARDGADALRIASGAGLQIDLVVTDVVMPGMNGREFVKALRGHTPGIPVLYISGYTDDDIIRRGLTDSSVAFLQKPFNAKSLARLVRSVLDAR